MSKKTNNTPQEPKMPKFNLTWLYFAIIAVMAGFLWFGSSNPGSSSKDISYSELKEYIAKGYSNEIIVDKGEGQVSMVIRPEHIRTVFHQSAEQVGAKPKVRAKYPSADRVEDYLNASDYKGKVTYEETHNVFLNILTSLLPIVFFVGIWFFVFRGMSGGGGSLFGVGKSKAKEYTKGEGVDVTFKDVAGQEGAKQEVKEIVDFLKNPNKYTELGGKIPKGALLVGPPGTGKTLLAKAVAGEAGVPFFSMSGSDFVEMFVGVGASRVRDLFQKAKEKAPSIVFIDEIDAVGRARSKGASFGGNDERENTLNQLLTEMDGFGTNSGVIILAATNRVDVLDQALLRAGRFDRQIYVDLPDLPERIAIFNVHLRPLKLQPDLDIDLLARQTPGFSGADIANVCNEAALIAARHNREAVTKQDFLDAVDRIIGGLEKKTRVMTNEEKRAIAIHEAGHASVSWLLEHANPLVKVTIVPRGQSLGAAWYLPEERSITTKEQMLDEICATLAGRAAEEVFLGRISSGALNDLERVTQRAYGMVAYLGMSESLPNVSYYTNQESFQKPYSEETGRRIDAEVSRLINEQYERAKRLLTENAAKHNALADLLCEHEVIFAADVTNIFGPRPWKSRAEIIMEEQPPIHQETPTESSHSESDTASTAVHLETEVSTPVDEKGISPEANNTPSAPPRGRSVLSQLIQTSIVLMKNLVLRAITGTLYVAALVGCALGGELSFFIFFTLVGALTTWEFITNVNAHDGATANRFIATAATVAFMTAFRECCHPGHLTYVHFLPFVATLLYLLISELYRNEPHPLKNWAYAFAAQLYIALPLSMIFLLGVHYNPASGMTTYNGWLPLSVFFFLWTSDTGAYLCGSAFSRYIPAKLFPRISPNKSWIGSVGGGLLVVVLALVLSQLLPDISLSALGWVGLGLTVCVFGTWGDLVESLFKRHLGIKDSGKILPGHGGMLDRFDSALLAIPAAVLYLQFVG